MLIMIEKIFLLYKSSPIIYSLFIFIFFASISIWSFSIWLLKKSNFTSSLADQIRNLIIENKSEEALFICQTKKSFFAKVLACAIASRQYGPEVTIKAIEAEAKRQRSILWTQARFLKKLAWLALLFGLLGSVLSSFYAFNEVNQTKASLAHVLNHLKFSFAPLAFGTLILLWALFFYYILQHKLHEFSRNLNEEAISLSEFLSSSRDD